MIPAWNNQGILPPIRPGRAAGHRDRTPYRSDIVHFVERFALNQTRIKLLEGLLKYRKALHTIGFIDGFQWIDGSFAEHVEMTAGRDPRDIDCVTFYAMPDGENETSLYEKYPLIFDHSEVKSQFHVDSYYIDIADSFSHELLDDLTYWYSMWSHNRDLAWKGFIQLEMNPAQDENANILLEKIKAENSYEHP